MPQQFTARQLYEISYKKGHFIYIDNRPILYKFLKNIQGVFTLIKEEDRNAVTKNYFLTASSIQTTLL